MEPTYEGYLTEEGNFNFFKGDLIILEKKLPKIGDAILFRSPETDYLLFHRIIAIMIDNNTQIFITKGDNNENIDSINIESRESWVKEKDIIGVAIISIPLLGGLLNSIFNPIGFIIVVSTIIISLFLYTNRKEINEMLNIKKAFKALKEKEIKLNLFKKQLKVSMRIFLALITILLIVLTYFSLNVYFFISNSNPVSLLSIDGQDLPDSISLSGTHSFTYKKFEISDTTVYLYSIKLRFSSGGLFNSVANITVSSSYSGVNFSNSAKNFLNYTEYSILYSFGGEKEINSVLIFIDPFRFSDSIQAEVKIEISYSGLFSSEKIETTYKLNLK
jgi:signal peptidase I